MKTFIAAVALATLVAVPAFAQRSESPAANPSLSQAASQSRHQDGARNSDEVMNGQRAIGRDPDPWIRNEILRHSHSGWPD
jgi:hypothetical protein